MNIPDLSLNCFLFESFHFSAIKQGSNSLTGSIPSELGILTSLRIFELDRNLLEGSIPSELGLLTSLTSFELGRNSLEGSIPIELLNENFISNIEVYGNKLSNLIAVDGEVICFAGGGEVYCDCSDDCLNLEVCGCEEARSCCSSISGHLTECILCSSGKIENPDDGYYNYMAPYHNCQDHSDIIKNDLKQYGTEESCDRAKLEFEEEGCYCATEECVLCASGAIENPDTYLELHSASCQEMSNYILRDLIIYGTEEVCDEAKLWFEGVGCFCSGEQNDDSTEDFEVLRRNYIHIATPRQDDTLQPQT